MGILPKTQLVPTETPGLVAGFPTADVGGGSTCLGGTGGSPFSFGVGTGSWMLGHASRMFTNF